VLKRVGKVGRCNFKEKVTLISKYEKVEGEKFLLKACD